MNNTLFAICLLLLALLPAGLSAQEELPNASPAMIVIATDGTETEETGFDGSAPLNTRFEARPEHVGDYVPLYEWRFTRMGDEKPFLVRYEENTTYTFSESGSFTVELYISFVQGTDTIAYQADSPFAINISESMLEVPNAFTPNGDGINDTFHVKEGYRSIVEFKATVFNRWGKKIYEWTDPAGGWDGTDGGSDVPDGAYYLVLNARGADGRKYHFKKVINLLRGYTEGTTEGL